MPYPTGMIVRVTMDTTVDKNLSSRLNFFNVTQITLHGDYIYIKPLRRKQAKLLRDNVIDMFVEITK